MAKLKDDFRALSGPQKAAIFMLSFGQEQSGVLFERMD
ncbi:MAG: flagellar motor switch protein FliG, partial [Proteobacteria bacterium]|nr:flagellar motor switch protein FliG [Pseudomonadota bacterium]